MNYIDRLSVRYAGLDRYSLICELEKEVMWIPTTQGRDLSVKVLNSFSHFRDHCINGNVASSLEFVKRNWDLITQCCGKYHIARINMITGLLNA